MLREDSEREARATYVMVVRPFGDDDESLLAGGRCIGWRRRTRYWLDSSWITQDSALSTIIGLDPSLLKRSPTHLPVS